MAESVCEPCVPEMIQKFTLPTYAPRWARALGLRMDWQSRPTDRERMYHDVDRNVELVVGRRGNRWACEVSRYSEYTSLHLACPWLALHWRIGKGDEPPIGEMSVDWGWYVHEDHLRVAYGRWSKMVELNPFRWSGYESARLRADGEWDLTQPWTGKGKAIDWYSEDHPYLCVGKPSYHPHYSDGPHCSVEQTEATATCYVTRTTRTRRWLPFWRKVQWYVYFDLDAEIGPGKGSWKGGTVGFSEPMLPGDDVATVVGRAVRKGRGV